ATSPLTTGRPNETPGRCGSGVEELPDPSLPALGVGVPLPAVHRPVPQVELDEVRPGLCQLLGGAVGDLAVGAGVEGQDRVPQLVAPGGPVGDRDVDRLGAPDEVPGGLLAHEGAGQQLGRARDAVEVGVVTQYVPPVDDRAV